jgi:hypothetical protein
MAENSGNAIHGPSFGWFQALREAGQAYLIVYLIWPLLRVPLIFLFRRCSDFSVQLLYSLRERGRVRLIFHRQSSFFLTAQSYFPVDKITPRGEAE